MPEAQEYGLGFRRWDLLFRGKGKGFRLGVSGLRALGFLGLGDRASGVLWMLLPSDREPYARWTISGACYCIFSVAMYPAYETTSEHKQDTARQYADCSPTLGPSATPPAQLRRRKHDMSTHESGSPTHATCPLQRVCKREGPDATTRGRGYASPACQGYVRTRGLSTQASGRAGTGFGLTLICNRGTTYYSSEPRVTDSKTSTAKSARHEQLLTWDIILKHGKQNGR